MHRFDPVVSGVANRECEMSSPRKQKRALSKERRSKDVITLQLQRSDASGKNLRVPFWFCEQRRGQLADQLENEGRGHE